MADSPVQDRWQDDEILLTVYTAPGCMGCAMTQRKLEQAGVEFATVDLSERPDLVAEFRAEGFRQAPIVQTREGDTWSGYRYDRIKAIVEAARPVTVAPIGNGRSMEAHPGVADGGASARLGRSR